MRDAAPRVVQKTRALECASALSRGGDAVSRSATMFALTIFTSSFLLFLVQPIIAKQILPWFGGSAGGGATRPVFFQSVLLAGYAYADLSTRLGPRRQALVHLALLGVSLACLPIIASS